MKKYILQIISTLILLTACNSPLDNTLSHEIESTDEDKNVGSITEASHPLIAFSDSAPEDQFTWQGDQVTFNNGAESITSNN